MRRVMQAGFTLIELIVVIVILGILAVKPFGCMPSSGVSDRVQSLITTKWPDALFLPIETSGEGQINAYRRVQMALAEAKLAARAEFDRALASTGRSIGEVRAFVAEHPDLRSPFYPIPKHRGVAGAAANLVLLGAAVAAHVHNREVELDRLQEALAEVRRDAAEGAELAERLEQLRAAATIVSTRRTAWPTLVEVLEDLSVRVPDDTYLQRVELRQGELPLPSGRLHPSIHTRPCG